MEKDQGVGPVVNNILYPSCGYHMVFRIVEIKKGVMTMYKNNTMWTIVQLNSDVFFKVVFILMCDYNSEPACS